jgi:hypothetical protein
MSKATGWDEQRWHQQTNNSQETQAAGRDGLQQVNDKLQKSRLAKMDTNRPETSFNRKRETHDRLV